MDARQNRMRLRGVAARCWVSAAVPVMFVERVVLIAHPVSVAAADRLLVKYLRCRDEGSDCRTAFELLRLKLRGIFPSGGR